MNDREPLFDEETETLIRKIFTRGNTVELKKANGRMTLVEIERHKRKELELHK